MTPIVRLLAALPLMLAAMFASPAALAVDSGDILVVSLKGEVQITVNGATRNLRAGGVLEPPATLRTGRYGAVELKQGATTVSVGPETVLEFPALEKRGAPVDRILQPKGNAFYDIGKREGRKLRIETPYLVGVVKGTQFNVAAQDESTTISLFEGALEIHASDDSDIVDLKAGHIAMRKRGDLSIGVMKMNDPKPPAINAPAPPPAGNGTGKPRTPPLTGGTRHVDGDRAASPAIPEVVDTLSNTGAAVSVGVTASNEGVAAGLNTAVGVANPIGVAAGIAADTAPAVVDVTAGTRLDAGPVSVDAGAAVNTGGGPLDVSSTNVSAGPIAVDPGAALTVGTAGVDVSTSTGIDAGPVSVDAGAALSVGPSGVDVTTGAAVDAGPVSVDSGAAIDVGSTGVDVTTGTAVDAGPVSVDTAAGLNVGTGVDLTTTTAVDAGPIAADVGASTAVDLGAGAVDTGVIVGASVPGVSVDVGTSVAADVAAGTVNLGLEVAGADLGVGLDLGLDDTDTTPETSTPDTDTGADTENTNTVVDVGGLLDGLLRRPGRR